jgi:hypothetical protein
LLTAHCRLGGHGVGGLCLTRQKCVMFGWYVTCACMQVGRQADGQANKWEIRVAQINRKRVVAYLRKRKSRQRCWHCRDWGGQ